MVEIPKQALEMLAEAALQDWIESEGCNFGVVVPAVTRIELLELTAAGWRWERPNTRGLPKFTAVPKKVWWSAGSYFRFHWLDSRGQRRAIRWWFARPLTNLQAFDF